MALEFRSRAIFKYGGGSFMGTPIRIVVLGGGYGGVLTAKKLVHKLKKHDGAEITLIDLNAYHTMLTELHEVAAGRVPEQSIRIDLKTIFCGRPVQIVQDEIIHVDFDAQVLTSEKAVYAYDYLVLGTGSKPTFFGVKGAKEHCFQLWSYDDAVRLKEHIISQFRKASNEGDREARKSMLRFITVGCGFTGVEMAGELAEWTPRLCREFRIDPDEVEVLTVDVLPKVLPIFPDKLIEKVERRLKKLGVKVHTSTGVEEVGSDHAILGNLGTVKSDTVIWTAGIEGSTLAGSLALKKEARHRVVTNEFLQAVENPRVFVVGDNAFAIVGDMQRPVPQMVENAEHSSALVAHNICAAMNQQPLKVYDPQFHGAMVSVGGGYGVAHLGLPGKFLSISGFPAMFVKHLINLVYFFQVAGFTKCWSYLKFEFFKVLDRRSFVGGHFAKASPNFWLVPIRIFLGYKWFDEGWQKLPRLLADPGDVFLIPAPVSATSAATAAAAVLEGTTETVSQWGASLPVPDFISVMTHWFMGLFFYTPDGSFTVLAQLFQGAMIMGELAVGLCLLSGLCTFPASIAAILMGLMIWSSGMAPIEMLWYLAAAFATMGGSGSVFGLDYYVLPWLKRHWNRIPFIRKWYLFID